MMPACSSMVLGGLGSPTPWQAVGWLHPSGGLLRITCRFRAFEDLDQAALDAFQLLGMGDLLLEEVRHIKDVHRPLAISGNVRADDGKAEGEHTWRPTKPLPPRTRIF